MASVSELDSGTRTTSPAEGSFTALGTDPQTAAHAAAIFVDLSVMQSGDTTVIQLVEKATGTGDTQRVVWQKTFTGAQSTEPGLLSPMLPLIHGWAFQMKQTAGSSRSYKWSIRVAGD